MAHRYIVAGVSPRSEGDGERDDECGGFNDGMDDEVEARVSASPGNGMVQRRHG